VLYHDPDPDRLAAQLDYLTRHYAPISLDRLVHAMRSGTWDRLPPRSVVVTLDDGHAGNFALLEEFRTRRITPTIFLCTAIVGTDRGFWFTGLDAATLERAKADPSREIPPAPPAAGREALSAEEVHRLAGTCDFGSHTRNHPILATSPDAVAEAEIADSRAEVEALTGRPCRHFAYPAGAHSDRDVAFVTAAGYDSARTVDIGWNGPLTDPYRLRVMSIDSASTTMLAAELAGLKWLARLVNRKGDVKGRRTFSGDGR